jgi:peptidoglycan hydrolase CwlO-like protein
MFGMQDPSQTLLQIERYMAEGRLELSEVMATQFCDLMLSNKKRDPQQQIFLLKGLRLMCDVYLLRNKADQSMKAIKRMHGERKALVKVLEKHAPQMLATMQPEHEDHLRAGRLLAAAGKTKAAAKAFARCEKLAPGHLAAAQAAVEAQPTKAHVQRLLAAIELAGNVISTNGRFVLQPTASPEVELERVVATLNTAASTVSGLASSCEQAAQKLQSQQTAIMAGEQAANARLQSALDSLQPKHDYYQYG